MTADAAVLASLPGLACAAMLIFARVGAAAMLLPGLGEAELPATVRLVFALALTVLLTPSLAGAMPEVSSSPVGVLAGIARETVTGLWLGLSTRIVMLALPAAGQTIASAAGLSNVLQPDAALGQPSVISRLLAVAAPVALFATGLHDVVLRALVASYRLVPAGSVLPVADGVATLVGTMGETALLALRLGAPFIVAGTVWQMASALLARLVPQLQIYFAAMPAQIMGGLALLGLTATSILTLWGEAARAAFSAIAG